MSAFPDVRWGREGSPLRGLAVRISCTQLGSGLIKRLTGPEDERCDQKMIEVARTYDEYRSRTRRAIRVFRLEAAT